MQVVKPKFEYDPEVQIWQDDSDVPAVVFVRVNFLCRVFVDA